MFEATELSFTYPSGRRGLGSVSLGAGPGDRVVVMGPNGSGKSTFLRLVSTELPCPQKSLKLFGQARGPAVAKVRKRIGIVQDAPVHVDDLTGLENGLLFADLYGIEREEATRELEALFTSLGLDEALHVPTREYSYGMKKKLLIAEALVHAPEMLILDEPALGLDPPSRSALLGMLRALSSEGVCTLVATNEPSLAEELATLVVLLHEGNEVVRGSPAELLAKVGGATRIEVEVATSQRSNLAVAAEPVATGPRAVPPTPSAPRMESPAFQGLRADLVSIRRLPDRIIAESDAGPDVLPQLVSAILDEGLRIERIEVREPDLTDVFTHFTGQTLSSAEK